MASEPSSVSGYAAARAALRDTVKWLVAAFASIAAVIVAGGPLSSANLDSAHAPFWISLGFAVAALVLVGCGLSITLGLLRPDGLYATELCRPKDGEKPEVAVARKEINDHAEDLLPPGRASVKDVLDERTKTLCDLEASAADPDLVAKLTTHLAELEAALQRALDFALYQILYARLDSAKPQLFGLGLATLACLTVSVAVGKAARTEKFDPVTLMVFQAGSQQSKPTLDEVPRLEPVLFQPGSAQITAPGLAAIEIAREVLEKNPGYVLLLAAHTDTMASEQINRDLSQRRGAEVRSSLLQQGGVQPSRVFISELPESALPLLTGDEVREARNRSVELVLARLPIRDSRLPRPAASQTVASP